MMPDTSTRHAKVVQTCSGELVNWPSHSYRIMNNEPFGNWWTACSADTQQALGAQPYLLVNGVGADLRTSLHHSPHLFAAQVFSWVKVWIPNCMVSCASRFSQYFLRMCVPPMYVRAMHGSAAQT